MAENDYEAGAKAREALRAQHDKERDDFHANHKADLKKMAKRHEDAIKALHDAEMKKLSGGKEEKKDDRPAKLYDRKKKE